MLYVKVRNFAGDRAICETAFGHTFDTRRSLFPATAAVGDAYTITLNADADGLDVVPICVDNSPRLKPGDSRLNDHCLQEQV